MAAPTLLLSATAGRGSGGGWWSVDGARPRRGAAAGGDASEGPVDGEEAITLMAELNAGATGTMPSALMPDLLKPLVEAHRAGKMADAAKQYANLLPLINFENRQCGLRACKTVFIEGGVIASDHVRHPMPPLALETRAQLLELATQLDPIALRWGH